MRVPKIKLLFLLPWLFLIILLVGCAPKNTVTDNSITDADNAREDSIRFARLFRNCRSSVIPSSSRDVLLAGPDRGRLAAKAREVNDELRAALSD